MDNIINVYKKLMNEKVKNYTKTMNNKSLSELNALINFYFVESGVRSAYFPEIVSHTKFIPKFNTEDIIFNMNNRNFHIICLKNSLVSNILSHDNKITMNQLGLFLGYNCGGIKGWYNVKNIRYIIEFFFDSGNETSIQIYAEVCPKEPNETTKLKIHLMEKIMNNAIKLLNKNYSINAKISTFDTRKKEMSF